MGSLAGRLDRVKDSSEYGWMVVTRAEYEKMVAHDHAGPGTPCHPDAPGVWCMALEGGSTVLYTGVQIVEAIQMAAKAGRIPTVEVTLRDGSVHLIRRHVGPPPRHAFSWAMERMPYGTDFRGAKFRKLYTQMYYETWKKFNAKVSRGHPGDCWLWTASLTKDGYGWFRDGKVTTAHRASYEHYNGPIPDGMTVDHVCRIRHCVHPDHLRLLTRAANVMIGDGLAAANARKTHCKRGHEFTPENTALNERGHRACIVCRRENERNRYASRRPTARGS